ncbi:MAG: hypothetical protein JO220_16130 [Hyphomicrobiales bacterium]|nr:hypothetical protein [Hyphomicrobiales bacterium]
MVCKKSWRLQLLAVAFTAGCLGLVSISGSAQQAAVAPTLVGPICSDQKSVTASNTNTGAALVVRINGADNNHASGSAGDVAIGITSPARLVDGDTVQVAQQVGSATRLSNAIVVGCTDVLTYHNDARRNGWNKSENTINATNVTASSFGLVAQVGSDILDEEIDAQPLIVTNQPIKDFGTRNVVYVVTAANSVYALDAWSGQQLRRVNLGKAVPAPFACYNNSDIIGIGSTPTIDIQTKTLYLVTYTLETDGPTYKLHALDLSTLDDRAGSPKIVAAKQKLGDQTDFVFNATYQRQRAALLQAGGNIYAGFASFCDFKALYSRGWVLGWNAATLAPVGSGELTNKRTDTPTAPCTYAGNQPCYLSSVWMSGYGLSADTAGNIFFSTSNTAPGTYDGMLNIGESVVKLSPDLSIKDPAKDLFTPNNAKLLDAQDRDLGSGGVMVLPDMAAETVPHLAVMAGKDGRVFILNRDDLGGFHTPDVPKNVKIDYCACGPSFFEGADGKARVVTSGGHTLTTWLVDTAQTPALTLEASAQIAESGQVGGFFTSVSSNGSSARTGVIWAVGRPIGANNLVTLYAFDAAASGGQLTLLWSGIAGSWPKTGGASNIVPTVANGMVYVASYRQLSIFGLKRPQPPAEVADLQVKVLAAAVARPAEPALGPTYWGTVLKIDGTTLLLELRDGRVLNVDFTPAVKASQARIVTPGDSAKIVGMTGPNGVFQANVLLRAPGRSLWGEDQAQ